MTVSSDWKIFSNLKWILNISRFYLIDKNDESEMERFVVINDHFHVKEKALNLSGYNVGMFFKGRYIRHKTFHLFLQILFWYLICETPLLNWLTSFISKPFGIYLISKWSWLIVYNILMLQISHLKWASLLLVFQCWHVQRKANIA